MGLPTPVPFARKKTIVAFGLATALIASLFTGTMAASADTSPVPPLPATVSTDSLPTVQIDGIVWSQVIVGNTVYAGGSFTTARPAGAAAGASTVPRANLLAYNLTTGALVTSFAPTLNGQVRSLAASPDGSRLYAAGEFTTVNGVSRNRIAAFSTATGALVTSFAPSANSRVSAVVATNDTVYFGGTMSAVSGVSRPGRSAAVSASNGAVLPWAPLANPDGRVLAMVLSPDNSKLVLGGSFTTMNGSSNPGYGLASVDAITGANLPWNVNSVVRNGGPDASITSLTSDGTSVHGTGYVFGSGGNLEGAFRADWKNGDLVWLEDCHGDSYSAYATGDVAYVAGHPHYCGNVNGGFEQTEPWTFYRGVAFTNYATGTLKREKHGYFNFEGNPSPTLLHFYPTFNTGTVSGASQGPWSVTGNGKYVVFAGEFTTVNGTRQQGLSRFVVADSAPNADGPRVSGSNWVPSVVSLSAGTARVAWPANFDRDNTSLTYRVIRNGNTGSPVHEIVGESSPWNRPAMGYLDTGLVPGETYTYRLRAEDPFGNVAWSNTVPVTIAAEGTSSAYASGVLDDAPTSYWRLGEASGLAVYDWAGFDDAVAGAGVTRGTAGAIGGDDNSSATFSGTNTGLVASQVAQPGSNSFAIESWVRTTSTAGGKIVGFGNAKTGNSSSYDRHVYMDGAGRIIFGVYPNAERTVSSGTGFNDGNWHHIVANLGPIGMQLFVDGKRVAQRTDTTSAQAYDGYWRIGGDSSWGGTAPYFAGDIDDVAIYGNALSTAQVDRHYTLSGRPSALPKAPSDAYGARVFADDPDLYWRLDDSSGSIAADASPSGTPGTYIGGVTKQQEGVLQGNASAAFDGSSGHVVSSRQVSGPQVYSTELWFSSTSQQGGKLIGFGNASSGTSGNYDRHVYLQPDGRLVFGIWNGTANIITSPAAYNDGRWHHVVATQAANGLRLYVDGELLGTHPANRSDSYAGYWRIGGDNTWGSSPFVNARIDEAAVYSTALSAEQVRAHYALASGVPVNAAPTASFTSSVNELAASFDASASSDSDGTIASYAWSFGDGRTGTGARASHTYAEAGTYRVSLTVTDDDGATAVSTSTVTVAVTPVPNAAPVASFTSAVNELAVSVDGSGSTDSDGTIASYAWSFGDGGTATGATASHTYAAAGTYTVTLTVTDDDGATATRTSTVTVTAPAAPPATGPLASDAFARSATGNWGSADTGGAWTNSSGTSSYYSVANGVGRHTTSTAGRTIENYLPGVTSTDSDVRATFAITPMNVGGSVFASVIGRRVGSEDYRTRAVIAPNGSISLRIFRGGTTLDSRTVSGVTYSAGDRMRLRIETTGTSPTTIRAKIWKVGTPEPTTWQVETTDSTAALQTAGHTGVSSYIGSGMTSLPLTVSWDDFTATTAGSTPAEEPGTEEPAPVPNAAPVGRFTSSVDGLTANVDASASSDADGTIASYAWNFGDGGTGTGATASRTYAAAGTYTVTLTVTDDDGATATRTGTVTVAAPTAPPAGVLAADAFARTATVTWGSADTGGAWTNSSSTSSYYSVANGVGRHTTSTAGRTIENYLPGVTSTDTDVQATFAITPMNVGGSVFASVIGRRVGTVDYRTRAVVAANGSITLRIYSGGTTLDSTTVSGLTYAAGDQMRLRIQTTGTSPTTIRAKIWKVGTTEPTTWQVQATDGTAALQTAGHTGVSSYIGSGMTSLPLTVSWDDFTVTPIQ
ncbi:PKD domain-containing protein [Planctomonas psychrotolerans]|uniref:PKD domain-containing protein n=1 Tax=Planctomonas psychrotolerans TaxID=2528712 RepID=UPI00123C330A|nr:PKD domain-containing protein [Planctomonas psychrotolerans]